MDTVYKYKIDFYITEIELPKGAVVLSVAFQRDDFCMWIKVNTEAEKETRAFVAFGTGHLIPRDTGVKHIFIGTGHMDNGLVFHAFELSL